MIIQVTKKGLKIFISPKEVIFQKKITNFYLIKIKFEFFEWDKIKKLEFNIYAESFWWKDNSLQKNITFENVSHVKK